LFAAIIGAFLGLIPSFYFLIKDRPIIKVAISYAYIPSISNLIQKGFNIRISNSRRRQITIDGVFLEFKNKETLIFPTPNLFVGGSSGLPKTLFKNSSHSVTILTGDVAFAILRKRDYPVAAYYRDVIGKVYRCKIPNNFWENVFKE